jgi:hypothetical protein
MIKTRGVVVYFNDDKVECRFGDYTVFFSRKLFEGFNLFPGAPLQIVKRFPGGPLQIIECKDENAAENNKDIFELWDGIGCRNG